MVTYRFTSLADLAEHFAGIARTRREEAAYGGIKKRYRTQLIAEAEAFEQAADIVRRVIIGERT